MKMVKEAKTENVQVDAIWNQGRAETEWTSVRLHLSDQKD